MYWKCEEQKKLPCSDSGGVIGSTILETSWHYFVKLKLQISYNTAIPLLATDLREIYFEDTCNGNSSSMFIIDPDEKQSEVYNNRKEKYKRIQ